MNILYFPVGARSQEDALDIGLAISAVIKWSNGERNKTRDRYRRVHPRTAKVCESCCRKRKIAIHHIKPVWACIYDEIMRNPPQTQAEYDALMQAAYIGRFPIPPIVTNFDNLIPLCPSCHKQADKQASRYWKALYVKQDRVVWGKAGKTWDAGEQARIRKFTK